MFDITKKKWIFLGISAVLVVASIISLIFKGFNLDIDFAGGMTATYTILGEDFSTSEIEGIVSEALGADKAPASVQSSEGKDVIVKFSFDNSLTTEEERSNYATEKIAAITAALEERYGAPVYEEAAPAADENADAAPAADENADAAPAADENAEAAPTTDENAEAAPAADENAEAAPTTDENAEAVPAADENAEAAPAADENAEAAPTADESADVAPTTDAASHGVLLSGVELISEDFVSPSTGQDLARSAVWMSLLAALAILIYVSFRFEFVSGVTAVLALAHDVIILLGIYSLLGLNVNISYIAAVLTVLGYSINNTIVIFDRIRENTRFAKKESYAEIANKSVWQTMNRSINTTITTLLTIGMVFILGVPSIREFSLPIIIGIVVGAYSSIFVSGTIWAMWRDSAVKGKGGNASKKTAKA